MIGAWSNRIVSVVGGYDERIRITEGVEDGLDRLVYRLQALRISLNVVTMAVEHIQVNHVREDQLFLRFRRRA